jgi:hypothetical protein
VHGCSDASCNIEVAASLENESDCQLIFSHDGDRQEREIVVFGPEIE